MISLCVYLSLRQDSLWISFPSLSSPASPLLLPSPSLLAKSRSGMGDRGAVWAAWRGGEAQAGVQARTQRDRHTHTERQAVTNTHTHTDTHTHRHTHTRTYTYAVGVGVGVQVLVQYRYRHITRLALSQCTTIPGSTSLAFVVCAGLSQNAFTTHSTSWSTQCVCVCVCACACWL